ncbi:MAG: hypothetical protein WKG01_24410 [Kofleriaceae bacterium]
MPLDHGVLATDRLQLLAGGEPRLLEQHRLVGGVATHVIARTLSASLIECAQVAQQQVHRRFDVRHVHGDLLTQRVSVHFHH